MTSTPAVFVDGVGHSQQRMLPQVRNRLSLPRARPIAVHAAGPDVTRIDYDKVVFDRLGRLTDGREVYAMATWKLFALRLHLNVNEYDVDAALARAMRSLNAKSKLVFLYSQTALEMWPEGCSLLWVIEGVAIPADA